MANRKKRTLDANDLRTGNYAVIASTQWDSDGLPSLVLPFRNEIARQLRDLKIICPSKAPYVLMVEYKGSIRISAVVPLTNQGALVERSTDVTSPPANQTLEASAKAEAEQIATVASKISQVAIDVGNQMASKAERRILPQEQTVETLAASPDERVSRKTYTRARGPEQRIQYANGDRTIGGSRTIPTSTLSTETFGLQRCFLEITKKGAFTLEPSDPGDDGWRRLQAHTPGIYTVKGQADSPIMQSLRCAALAGTPVDMKVCVAEKVATKFRWVEPIEIINKREIFAQARDWLNYLEETLDQ